MEVANLHVRHDVGSGTLLWVACLVNILIGIYPQTSLDAFSEGENAGLMYFLYFLFTVFTSLILMNVLIAVMSSVFTKVYENAENEVLLLLLHAVWCSVCVRACRPCFSVLGWSCRPRYA